MYPTNPYKETTSLVRPFSHQLYRSHRSCLLILCKEITPPTKDQLAVKLKPILFCFDCRNHIAVPVYSIPAFNLTPSFLIGVLVLYSSNQHHPFFLIRYTPSSLMASLPQFFPTIVTLNNPLHLLLLDFLISRHLAALSYMESCDNKLTLCVLWTPNRPLLFVCALMLGLQ